MENVKRDLERYEYRIVSSEEEEDVCVFCFNKDVNMIETPENRYFVAPRCGHQICNTCKEAKFNKATTAAVRCPAPECGESIHGNQLQVGGAIERERKGFEQQAKIRRQIMDKLILKFDDFKDSPSTLDTLLDLREKIIFNTINKVSADSLLEEFKIEYAKAGKGSSAGNSQLKAAERAKMLSKIQEEEKRNKRKKEKAIERLEKQKRQRKNAKEEKNKKALGELAIAKPEEVKLDDDSDENEETKKLEVERSYIRPFHILPRPLDPQPRTMATERAKLEETPDELQRLQKIAGGFRFDLVKQRTRELMHAT